MKTYNFDYIRKTIEQWPPQVQKTLEDIEMLPLGICLYDFTDPNGERVEDVKEWCKQRHEYCVNLVNEYKEKP